MKNIPFFLHDIGDDEIAEVITTLKSNWINTGPKVNLFEEKICQFTHGQKALAVNSATAGLFLSLKHFGIGEGDEVITTPYTFSATAAAIIHTGATPIVADIGPDWNISADTIADVFTDKTKAIISVDLGGYCCDYDALKGVILKKKHLYRPLTGSLQEKLGRALILADASHSLGGGYNSRSVGTLADLTIFSFHAVKNITTGDGGAICFNSIDGLDPEEMYRDLRQKSLHGMSRDALSKTKAGNWEYDIHCAGYKYNMTDIEAALGIVQLKRLPSFIKRRKEIYAIYNEILNKNSRLSFRTEQNGFLPSFHLYQVRIKDFSEKQRNQLIELMAEDGIVLNVHYKPLPMMTFYKNLGYNINDFPNSFAVYQNNISLPLYTKLTDQDTEFIAKSLLKHLQHLA